MVPAISSTDWSPKDDEIHALGMYIASELAKIDLGNGEIH